MRTSFAIVLFLIIGCDDGPPDAQQPSGQGETVFTAGDDPANPFFSELGTNQRTCETCHDRDAAWSVTPSQLQARFAATDGTDPIFRPVDGANSPTADVSTIAARAAAYDLLLTRGVIRVGQPVPAGAQFALSTVSDPYGFASAAELSLFRRPLPSANLRFLAEIMWDSREPTLDHQAADATLGHAQASDLDRSAVLARVVAFESSMYTAQRIDDAAGDLAADGAHGGAAALVDQEFRVGLNDPDAVGFNRQAFTLYAAWLTADTSTPQGQARASIARGERLFNTKEFRIRDVAGLTDRRATCSTCHSTPNIGSHSIAGGMNIGISDDDRRPDGFPLYTLTNLADHRTVRTTDPGLALITGRWNDIGKFKVPSLRGLARRPPYFHNGMADNLNDVVRFYNRRFGADFDGQDQADVVAFLAAL
jgi:cytochrome c peroxidase